MFLTTNLEIWLGPTFPLVTLPLFLEVMSDQVICCHVEKAASPPYDITRPFYPLNFYTLHEWVILYICFRCDLLKVNNKNEKRKRKKKRTRSPTFHPPNHTVHLRHLLIFQPYYIYFSEYMEWRHLRRTQLNLHQTPRIKIK